jgi:UPF0755 protein
MRLINRLFFIVFFGALGVTAGGAFYATRTLSLPGLPFEFSLKEGSSLKAAARQMQQAGVFSNDWAFVWLARILGKSTQIKAGDYQLESEISPLELLDMITQGQGVQNELSIIDGTTFAQLRNNLNANPTVRHDSLGLPEAEILQRIGAEEAQPEGLFYPATYYFSKGSSDLNLLKRAYQMMHKHLAESWQARAPGLPLETPYQALVLASIVEKETGKASDRAMIAGVFINRLRRNMLLQTDPTVIYGMGSKFDGNLRKRDLLADTPYNTYTRTGLPPTPIALPGPAALEAALHPAGTNALYFVARGDGSSEFSETLEQHNRAVNKYQK